MGDSASQDIGLERFLEDDRPGLRKVTYRENQTVFWQADPSNALFYISRGNLKLVVVSARGKEAVLAFLRKGDVFGEECLGRHPLRVAGAVAMTACSLIRIESDLVQTLFHEFPCFLEALTARLVSRTLQTAQDLADQLLYPSDQRLARTLFLLARSQSAGAPGSAGPEISQATLAGKVGTTRSRVNYFMNKFKKLGLIEYRGGLRIQPSLLTALSVDEDEMSLPGPPSRAASPSGRRRPTFFAGQGTMKVLVDA
jgi:CRP-like cAMP-binding protein